jgi:hypothetical protein
MRVQQPLAFKLAALAKIINRPKLILYSRMEFMFDERKRRHHYVWRHYLSSWCTNDLIVCMRNKSTIFPTALVNIAQQRDFYKVDTLNKEDLEMIRSLFVNGEKGYVKESFERIINLYSLVGPIESLPDGFADDNLKKSFASNLEEEFQTLTESQGMKSLENLLNGDANFIENDEDFAHFIGFLCMQYCRTKKHQDILFANYKFDDKESLKRSVNLIRFFIATKMGMHLYANKNSYKLVTVDNVSSIDFLTCDQPVINLFAVDVPKTDTVEKLAFYYPLSPRKAIFYIEKQYFGPHSHFQFNDDLVAEYNGLMIKESHEQVYARTEDLLLKYINA